MDYKIGVGVFVQAGNKILIGKRGKEAKSGNGYYALPGGFQDPGESIEECTVREVFEETGLEVQLAQFPFLGTTIWEEESQQPILVCWMHTYCTTNFSVGSIKGKEPTKCAEWEWVSMQWITKHIPQEPKQQRWIPIPYWRFMLRGLGFGDF